MPIKASLPFEKLKEQFPSFKHNGEGPRLNYLDSSATTLKPQCVIDAITDFYQSNYATVNRGVYQLAQNASEEYHNVRSTIQKFVNARSPNEIIFTKGATSSLNLLASSFSKAFLQENDEILISEVEHHANIVPWQQLAIEKKIHLKIIPVKDNGLIDLEAYKKLLSKRTKLVSVAHVSNVTGIIQPIKEITLLAHENGSYVCVDGAQAISRMTIDLQSLDCDFYVFSSHKLYGPTGVGVLYGKYELLEKLPPYELGGDMIEHVSLEKVTFQKPPLKFEAGTPPIAQVIGLGQAIEFLNSIGMEQIQKHEQYLAAYAYEALQKLPSVKIIGGYDKRIGLVSFIAENCHPLDIASFLDAKGIAIRSGHMCAQLALKRFGHEYICRISFGIYNTEEDIDQAVQALNQLLLLVG